jgi:excisionase family DNA binding protein
MTNQLHRLRQALNAHRQTLGELEEALAGFEEALGGQERSASPRMDRKSKLLSMQEVCEALGMGKSWTYRRIKSGEIPSVKLGRSIKVKREDLAEYLESRRYQPEEE